MGGCPQVDIDFVKPDVFAVPESDGLFANTDAFKGDVGAILPVHSFECHRRALRGLDDDVFFERDTRDFFVGIRTLFDLDLIAVTGLFEDRE